MADYRQEARRAAKRYGLDPYVFERQIGKESGFNPRARSPKGAAGIAQIMPETAKGWGVDPMNPVAALNAAAKNMARYVERYGSYDKALRAYNAGPGAIEASKGYAETNAYVASILRGRDPGKLGRSSGGGAGGDSAGALLTASAGGSAPSGMPQGSEGLVSLLAAMGEKPAPQVSAGIAPPAFSAQAVLPQGAQMPVSGGGPAPKPDVNALLEAIRTPGGDVPQSQVEGASSTVALPGGGSAPGGGGSGRVTLAPGADRAGVPTSRSILRVAEMVAGAHGKPLKIGTGSRHSRMTASGNVSDHWAGRGADIPASGAELTDLGRDALVALGVSPQKAAQMAKKGGIFNIPYGKKRRVQVIVNTDDHYDHLHLGVSPA